MLLSVKDNQVLQWWLVKAGDEETKTILCEEGQLAAFEEESRKLHPQYLEQEHKAWAAYNCYCQQKGTVREIKPAVLQPVAVPARRRWPKILEVAWKVAVLLLLSLIAARGAEAQNGTSFLDWVRLLDSAGNPISGGFFARPFSFKQGSNITFSVSGNTVTIASTGTSPLTTKGDLFTFTTLDARLPVGTNGQCLTADSVQTTGLLWGPCGGGATAWSGITNPTANLSLSHGAFTSTFTWGAATGAGINLFSFADTLNNTGTGFIFDFNRASGSVLAGPYRYRDNGVAKFQIAGSGRTRVATEVSVYETADVADNTNFSMFDIFSSGTTWRLQSHAAGTGVLRPILFGTDDNTAFTERLRLSTSGGLSLGTGAVDPGVGVFNVDTGYRLGNAAAAGNVLRGNGTNFVSAVLALADTTGTLLEGRGGTNQTTYTLGDLLYSSAANTLAKLAGNITTTKQFLSQTGTGAMSAAPGWAQPAFADLSGAATDAQVPNTITLDNLTQITTRAISDTTGTLAVGRGGTGAITFTLDGVLLGNTTSPVAVTAAGTANQVFRVPGAGGSPAFGAVDLAQAAAVTGLLPDANIAATITRDSEWPSATATLTNKTLDAEGTGNSLTVPFKIYYRPAVCQNATASIGTSTPTANAPAAACITGTNTQRGVLDFDAATDESIQDNVSLPSDQTGNIDLDAKWQAASITGSVVWAIQTICVADAETGDPAFNTASSATDAAKGTANQFNDFSITSITITGCAPGEQLFWRFFRDADNAADNMAGDARLISLTFTIRRTM